MIRESAIDLWIQWNGDLVIDKPISSILRGAFGVWLRKCVCVKSLDDECTACVQANACIYVDVFNPIVLAKAQWIRGVSNIAFDFDHRRSFIKGEVYGVRLKVYDKGVDHLAVVKDIFYEMGEKGIGPHRIGYSVLHFSAVPNAFTLREIYQGNRTLLLGFESPLRLLKNKNLLIEDLSIHELLKGALNRYDQLLKEKENSEKPIVFDEYIHQFQSLVCTDKKLSHYKMDRLSTRTKQAYDVDAVLGYLRVQGVVSPEIDKLLQIMEHYGIGKNTISGYGKVKVIVVK